MHAPKAARRRQPPAILPLDQHRREQAHPPLPAAGDIGSKSQKATLDSPKPSDMGAHMKTTIEIAPPALERTKRIARKEKTTLRALMHEGLELVAARRTEAKKFKYKPVTFRGTGLTGEFKDAPWGKIRDAIYEGHGA
jgi:hypothetical protein